MMTMYDVEAIRLVRHDFNISLQSSTVEKWRKQLLEMGTMQKGKPPRRPHGMSDAAIAGRILEMSDLPRCTWAQYQTFQCVWQPWQTDGILRIVAQECVNDKYWLRKLHISNEVAFHVNRLVNQHNCLYYARENPQVIEETRLRWGKVVVWAMIGWEGFY